jgi:DNA modification methylase
MTSSPILQFDAPTSTPDPEQVRWQLGRVKWDFSGFVPSAGISGIHSLHWYPAPFPPALAATLLDILRARSGVFIDPFAGSGVAPLEAWLRGYQAFGIDNNQFATELCRAKSRLLQRATAASGQLLVGSYRKYRHAHLSRWLKRTSESICALARINDDATRWFTRDVLADIAVVKAWLGDPSPSGPGEWRDVARVVFSSLLHGKLSTVRNYHYTYVVDRSRVKKRALSSVDVESVFAERLHTNFLDADYTRARLARTGTHVEQLPEPEFTTGLAQGLAEVVRVKADLVVTSPPYFGMNDYVRSQYLTWLVFPWEGYEEQIKTELGSRRARGSRQALEDYFSTIEKTFQSLRTIMTPGRYMAVIMGNSTSSLARESDPTHQVHNLITTMGFEPVWQVQRRIRFRKINNTPYRSESLWVFSR